MAQVTLQKFHPSKGLWQTAGHSVQNVSHWKNSESSTRAYTAKASFRILLPGDQIKTHGECINIDQNETISKKCCGETFSNLLLNIAHKKYRYVNTFLNSMGFILGLLILFNVIPNWWSYPLGGVWLILPIQIFLTANRDVMWRIWRKSMIPYLQLYMSFLETWAFCDLCGWDERILIVAPPMLLNQVMIINSDAVYFRSGDKNMILIQAFISILWKLIMLYCLRFGYFTDMHPRKMITLMTDNIVINNSTNTTTGTREEFYLNNISVYAGKTSSMIVLLMGQIIFRIRHPEQAYALRTHYTVKSNREWNEMNRHNRIQKKDSLKCHVEETRDFLDDVDVEVVL